MSRTPKKSPLVLEMDFEEALRRFSQTEPDELKQRLDEEKKAKQSYKNNPLDVDSQ